LDIKTAKVIGRRCAIKGAVAGLCIAYLIFAVAMLSWEPDFKKALFWIVDVEFKLHLSIAAIGLLTMAYFFGQFAGIEILIKKRNYWLTGVKYSILTVFTGTLIGSSVGFFQEGLRNIGGFGNPFYDYYFKPMFWVAWVGTIPAVIVGLLFGRQIKKHEKII
jgi:hypothetical protein